MTESLVTEWLADCEDLQPTELRSFADSLSRDNEIVRALYVLLEERSKYNQLVDTVCLQLFSFYRSDEEDLKRFTLQFVPSLIYIYLNSVAHADVKNCRAIETLLIGIYNLEVVDKNGQPKTVSFRLPSLAMMSIYHEPTSLAHASLTESAIRRFEECNTKPVTWGPLKQVEIMNAQNRLKVITALLFIYNQQLSFISKSSLEQLCKVTTKLVTQGFMKPGHHQRSSYGSDSSFVPRLLPRIPVSNQLLLEFLHSIYYAMYNDCWPVGFQAVEDIHNRGCFEMYPDVMLVTNAIRNLTSSGPPGQPGDSLGVALSSVNPMPTVSKSMITNASFRTKKLPDDLEELLIEMDEPSAQGEKQQTAQAVPAGTKRRNWLWKHAHQNSVDNEEGAARSRTNSVTSTSAANSRRESGASSQGSPLRSSPKRGKDGKSKKIDYCLEDVLRRPRRDSKDRSASPGNESRLSAGARLYRVLEEQALGEAVNDNFDNFFMENARRLSVCTTTSMKSNRYTKSTDGVSR